MVPWVLVVTLVWSQFLHCRGLHTLFSHPTVPNRHTIPFCHVWLIVVLFLQIFLDVLQNIFQKVFLYYCYYCYYYYSGLHTLFSHHPVSNLYKATLCRISFKKDCPSKYFWIEYIFQNILRRLFFFVLKISQVLMPEFPLLDAAILSSASICFKESEASNLLHLLFFYPALFCEANLICVDCMLYEQKEAPTTQLISSVFSFT